MIIVCTKHSLDRVIERVHKIKTPKQAKRYLKSKFKKFATQDTFNWYPIFVYNSWKTSYDIYTKWHYITYSIKKNKDNVSIIKIITYYYENDIRFRPADKDEAYKIIEKFQRDKDLI